MEKNIKKSLFIIIAVIAMVISMLLIYFANGNTINDTMKFKKEYETYNNNTNGTSYLSVNIKNNDKIVYIKEEELLDKLDTETAVFYFGFPTCPWCRNIIEPLLETTKKNNVKLYYFNPSEMRNGNSDTYQKLINKLKKYLTKNEDGQETLYVPDVYFVKNGEIVGNHMGSVESQKNPNVQLTTDQVNELTKIYNDNIKKMK